MTEIPYVPPTLARRILTCSIEHMRAYDALSPDAHAARERVMQAGEIAVNKLLAETPK